MTLNDATKVLELLLTTKQGWCYLLDGRVVTKRDCWRVIINQDVLEY